MSKSPKPSRRPAARSVASAAFPPAELRARADGWTPDRQQRFIAALAESGCVEEACRATGISRTSAYRLRVRPEAQAFRLAWDAAMDVAIRRLSDACYARAIHGEVEPIFYHGEQVGERRRYDNKLAMFLLRYRDPLRYAATLDQMVYSGHPEASTTRYVKAMNRVLDEGHGFADDCANDDEPPMPWSTQAISEARADAADEALAESGAPVHGSYDRKQRIAAIRRRKEAAAQAAKLDDPEYRARFEEAQRRFNVLPYERRGDFSRPFEWMDENEWKGLLKPEFDPDRPENQPRPPKPPAPPPAQSSEPKAVEPAAPPPVDKVAAAPAPVVPAEPAMTAPPAAPSPDPNDVVLYPSRRSQPLSPSDPRRFTRYGYDPTPPYW